jgi:hypothetical protein
MPKKILIFFASGIAWIFLLSIPVGQGKTFFDLAHFYLVDSKPVHWVKNQFSDTVSKTRSASEGMSEGYQSAEQSTQVWYQEKREALSRAEGSSD